MSGISSRSRIHASPKDSQKALSLKAIVKAFSWGILCGLLFLLLTPEPEYQEQNTVPQQTEALRPTVENSMRHEKTVVHTATPQPSPFPTPFPTTPAPTEFQCKAEVGFPFWAKSLTLAKKLTEGAKSVEAVSIDESTFYIDEDPQTDLLIGCFLSVLGIPQAKDCQYQDDWKCAVDISNIQRISMLDSSYYHILSDISLLEAFRNHKNRVQDPTKAKFILVDFLASLSRALPNELSVYQCSEKLQPSHDERAGEFAARLRASSLWQAKKGSDHMFIQTSPVATTESRLALSKDLHHFLVASKNPVFLTSSDSIAHIGKKTKGYSDLVQRALYSIVVPETLNHFVGSNLEGKSLKTPKERTFSLYVDENFEDDKRLTTTIKMMANMFQDAGEKVSMNSRKRKISFLNENAHSVKMMRESTFCLIFSDVAEKPGKTRLYDALGSGCIPIFMDIAGESKNVLPFLSQVDWNSISYSFTSRNCIKDNPAGTVRYLQTILEESRTADGEISLLKMQKDGQEIYKKLRSPELFRDYRLPVYMRNQQESTSAVAALPLTDDAQASSDDVGDETENGSFRRALDAEYENANEDEENDVPLDAENQDQEGDIIAAENKEQESDIVDFESEGENVDTPIQGDDAKDPASEKTPEPEKVETAVQTFHEYSMPDNIFQQQFHHGVVDLIIREWQEKPRYHVSD